MPTNILMPALSPTMTEGTLAKWHVKEGDKVVSGDVIAEIETDKATMEVEAVDEGTIGKIYITEGTEGVSVNEIIAVLLEEGESAKDMKEETAEAEPKETPGEGEPTAKKSESIEKDESGAKPNGGVGIEKPVGEKRVEGIEESREGERVFASPLARRMAQQAGIDLSQIEGSGPRGRIIKADIDSVSGKGAPARGEEKTPLAAPTPATPTAPQGPSARKLADLLDMPYSLEPLSNMRKTIAQRLSEAKQTVPHFYLTVDCEIDELLSFRKKLNAKLEDAKISVNDIIIRAVAIALKKVPAANASFDLAGMLFYEHADISIAVATPNGLITPIIKAAEAKGIAEISKEMKDLAGRAREGKLKPHEYQGGTFSLSNLGMFGIREFSAIINPPQGCILAVGAGEQRAVVKSGELAVATVMSCTLSVDHRVVDGAVGAEFLKVFKGLVEDPLTMLL